MARGTNKSAYAFPAEVARFLEVDPDDVARMIERDSLPATRIPKRTRPVWRIYLPDFHRWVLDRSSGKTVELGNYRQFLTVFRERSERRTDAAA